MFILICDELEFKYCDDLMWDQSIRHDFSEPADGRMQFDLMKHPTFDE